MSGFSINVSGGGPFLSGGSCDYKALTTQKLFGHLWSIVRNECNWHGYRKQCTACGGSHKFIGSKEQIDSFLFNYLDFISTHGRGDLSYFGEMLRLHSLGQDEEQKNDFSGEDTLKKKYGEGRVNLLKLLMSLSSGKVYSNPRKQESRCSEKEELSVRNFITAPLSDSELVQEAVRRSLM
jgi:hypothetical protein